MAGRARRSVEVRREEILSATVELFDRLGLGGDRVADVAAGAGRQHGAGVLPLRHQGRAGHRGVRARGGARPAPDGEGRRRGRPGGAAAPGAAAVRADRPGDRLADLDRRVGGRRSASRSSASSSSGSTTAGRTSCAAWSTTASRRASSPARPGGHVAALGAGRRAVRRALVVHSTRHPRTAAQLGGRAAAVELGVRRRDPGLSIINQPVRCVVGLGQRRPVEPERRHVGRRSRRSSPGRPAAARTSART